MANVVLEAVYPPLEDNSPILIDRLVPILAFNGIEISGPKLERIISEFLSDYKCQDNHICVTKESPRKTIDPQSLEEIRMCFKSLDVNENIC
ncbi:hypothetical protein TCAL_14547 [Tigriopus californicus]|uniref:Uncharacterized protein n=1 Tax=Tigriopus californicus TaxID=6832 RepID=A0A553PAN3_TIGCA|nr:hypothetical protein TCAL_14547 [Tigriopus californicus]